MGKSKKNKPSVGWIKVSRKLVENPISSKPTYLSVWIHLLLMANHKETYFIWNNKKQTLKPGQLLTGLKKLSKKTGIPQGTVYRILKYLENEKQIEQKKTTKFTVITIVNWGKYQTGEGQNEKQIENRLKTNEKQIETYKNVNKNDNKNVKENISKDIAKPSYGNKDINTCIEYLKEKVGGQLDGTEKSNRQYCYNLIRKIKKGYPDLDAVEQVKIVIDIATADPFHSKNATSFKYLFYNFVKIIKQAKENTNRVVEIK